MRRFGLLLLLGVCSFLGGLTAHFCTNHWLPFAAAQSDRPLQFNDVQRLSERFEIIASRVSPSVVAIEAIKPSTRVTGKTVDESGSGVLVRLQGRPGVYVFTNNHVVQRAAPEKITVSLSDNRLFKPARVWTDPESDIAVLQLQGVDNLTTAPMGDSDGVRVGQWVLAFGSPFGLNQTVTHGIISARERGQVSLGATIRIKDFLQTDAAINPGSSGGPLINLEGEVIGINTAIASPSGSNSGVAFSIPINLVKQITSQLLDRGSVARGYLGLQVAQAFEPADAEKLGLLRAQGAWIEKVYPDTPAARAGMRANDVVMMVDQVVIRNENHFINLIANLSAGQKTRMEIWRDRRAITIEAVVGDWSQGQSMIGANP